MLAGHHLTGVGLIARGTSTHLRYALLRVGREEEVLRAVKLIVQQCLKSVPALESRPSQGTQLGNGELMTAPHVSLEQAVRCPCFAEALHPAPNLSWLLWKKVDRRLHAHATMHSTMTYYLEHINICRTGRCPAVGPDEGQAGEPADHARHLLAAQQRAAEQRRQEHRQAADQVRHRGRRTARACSAYTRFQS